jgi:hypothetical protein
MKMSKINEVFFHSSPGDKNFSQLNIRCYNIIIIGPIVINFLPCNRSQGFIYLFIQRKQH